MHGSLGAAKVVVDIEANNNRGMLPVQHISLSVNDNADSLAYYTEVLGFETLDRPDFGIPGTWLETGNGIQIHLVEDAEFVAPAGPHIAFETGDMTAEVDRLRSLGVEVSEPYERNGSRQAFFHDPSGNQFELNEPPSTP